MDSSISPPDYPPGKEDEMVCLLFHCTENTVPKTYKNPRAPSSSSQPENAVSPPGLNLLFHLLGRKLIQDEAIGKFRDEHSSPFSVKTRSQLNLRTFEEEKAQDVGPSEDYNKILSHKLAQEAAKRAAILSPQSRAKEHAAPEPIDSTISYNKIRNETEDTDGNFISKFINRLSTTNGNGGNNYLKEQSDEHENLVSNINLSLSTQHSEDSEEELHHTEKSLEFKSLLQEADGFDFLNNW